MPETITKKVVEADLLKGRGAELPDFSRYIDLTGERLRGTAASNIVQPRTTCGFVIFFGDLSELASWNIVDFRVKEGNMRNRIVVEGSAKLEDWYAPVEIDEIVMEQVAEEAAQIYIAEEVCLEIKELDLENEVDTALFIIRETYRTLGAGRVIISKDPEIPGKKRVKIILTVSGTPEEVFKDELQFKEHLYSALDIEDCELITVTYKWED